MGENMRLKSVGIALAMAATLVATATTQISASGGYFCDDQPATIVVEEEGILTVGTDGDDVIVGTFGDDRIDGGGGNDTICGHAGDDVLRGGPGDDHIQGGNDTDRVLGGQGDDVLFGGNGDDEVNGQRGTDIVLGEAGNDVLIGDPEIDTLWPGPGDDEIVEVDESSTVDEAPSEDADAPEDDVSSDESDDLTDEGPSDDDSAGEDPTDDAGTDVIFDPEVPLFIDSAGPLDPGVAQFTAGGTPFTATFPEGWQVLANFPDLAAFGTGFSDGAPVNDLVIFRPNALSNPDEAGTFIEDQVAPFDVRDIEGWLAAMPAEIFPSAPVETTLGGRDAVMFEVSYTDTSVCRDGVFCLSLGGNTTSGINIALEPDVDYFIWAVDMGEFDPTFVFVSSDGEIEGFTEQALEIAATIAFGEPGPNPSPAAEAPWEIGGFGEVPAGPVELPIAGGLAVDIPLVSITGLIEPGLHFLTMGTQPSPTEMDIFTPVSDAEGNAIATAADFIAAGDVVGFTATEIGSVETRVGTATVIDIVGPEVFTDGPPPEEPTSADIGILTNPDSQFGWQAPIFGRAWLIESERGLIAFTAELFQGGPADLEPLISYVESVLPSLRFVDQPDGALPIPLTEIELGPVAAGDYIAELANPILVQTNDEIVVPFVADNLAAFAPIGAEGFDSLAIFDTEEVVTNTAGETAPIPDDLGAFLEGDERLLVEDSGTLLVSGVEARWWDLTSVDGAGFPADSPCPLGNCVPILVNSSAGGGQIVIGNELDFRLFEIPDPDGTSYAVAQSNPADRDLIFNFADELLSGVEVLPAPEVIEFAEGDILGIEQSSTFEAGTYFTNEVFSVPFELVTDQDWRLGFAADTAIGIESPDFSIQDGFQALIVLEPTTGFADPGTIGGPEAMVESTIGFPTDLVAWVDAIPQLDVLNSGTREISGIDAPFIDLALDGPADRNGDCNGTSCLRLFEWAFDGWHIFEGSPMRLYVIEAEGTTFVIAVESPEDSFDAFLTESDPLLDGITFG